MYMALAIGGACVAVASATLAGLVFQPAAGHGIERARGLNMIFVTVALAATLLAIVFLALWFGHLLLHYLHGLAGAEGHGETD